MLRISLALLLASTLSAELPYPDQMAKFRTEREQELRQDWLPLVGLYWLKEGDNRVGSNAASEVLLPLPAPAAVGTLSLQKGKVYFRPVGSGSLHLKNGQ